jgi:hypothetical protein
MPASISSPMRSGLDEDGPRVHTIFVRLIAAEYITVREILAASGAAV